MTDMSHIACWNSVKRKDRTADGSFVYAVITTGVYCRPSCPARLPLVKNVLFFPSNEAAERAGFRSCKRCTPAEASPHKRRAEAVKAACALLEAAEDRPDYAAIARQVGLSRYHFQRVFKDMMGISPGSYLKAHRKNRVVASLREGSSVTQAIYDAGYSSSSRFYESVAPELGVAPASYARKGAGEVIRFAVGACSLGAILVAATAKGVCAIQFGDDAQALVDGLHDTFPKAELIGGDEAFEHLVAKVVGAVEQPKHALGLPLDVRGTAFQHKVWRALRDIPVGTTLTYAQVAAQIGHADAVRAVANACANNRIAVAIPCHRVVRTGGGLAGYRWGVERKAELLKREDGVRENMRDATDGTAAPARTGDL